jgi:hypothetical protein
LSHVLIYFVLLTTLASTAYSQSAASKLSETATVASQSVTFDAGADLYVDTISRPGSRIHRISPAEFDEIIHSGGASYSLHVSYNAVVASVAKVVATTTWRASSLSSERFETAFKFRLTGRSGSLLTLYVDAYTSDVLFNGDRLTPNDRTWIQRAWDAAQDRKSFGPVDNSGRTSDNPPH